jgi:hypothetical protein
MVRSDSRLGSGVSFEEASAWMRFERLHEKDAGQRMEAAV